ADDAEPLYREALAAAGGGASLPLRSIAGFALCGLGQLLRERGRREEAAGCFAAAGELFEELWGAAPGNVDLGVGLTTALSNLGTMLREAGQPGQAAGLLGRAVQIGQTLWNTVESVQIGSLLALACNNLGLIQLEGGEAADAEEMFRLAEQIGGRL